MSNKKEYWFQNWFNRDYLLLYPKRDAKESVMQIDFIEKAMHLRRQEAVLDLGCGAGRHSIELAKRGYDVTGVDLSEYLIKMGKEELFLNPGLKAKFLVKDIYQLENIGFFDVVLNLFTSFGYYEEEEKNEEFFKIAYSHLKEEGKLFLDFLHPHQVLRDLVEEKEIFIEGEKVRIFKRIEKDRVIKTIIFSSPQRSYKESVKLYTKAQIQTMLEKQAFKVVDIWNDYEGSAWRADGDRQLFYAVKEKL